jgi:hypothetical protein
MIFDTEAAFAYAGSSPHVIGNADATSWDAERASLSLIAKTRGHRR